MLFNITLDPNESLLLDGSMEKILIAVRRKVETPPLCRNCAQVLKPSQPSQIVMSI